MTPRLDVYQSGEMVGTLPGYPPRSRCPMMFDIRSGDFSLYVRKDGSQFIEVNPMVGPGDLSLLAGFSWLKPAQYVPPSRLEVPE